MDTSVENMVKWIHNGDAISVSDGFLKTVQGTSSWRILNKYDEGNVFAGANFVSGLA
jgi:hypothetical protein